MESFTNEINLNGKIYVNANSYWENKITPPSEIKIVRSYAAGVFYGEIFSKEYTPAGLVVVMNNARRIWYWEGAASLSQLAMEGTSLPQNCKFPCKVNTVELINVCEILDMTDIAVKSLESVEVWKA